MKNDQLCCGFNLLRLRPIRALVLWPGFPYVFQFITLAIFVTLAIIGWGHFAPVGINDKLYAKTNIVNLIIWGLWWPSMVWLAVLFGRIWCTVCPLELVANGAERLGRRLGVRQLILGKWLRSGAVIVGLYAIIQLCVAGAHLHRIPAYTSLFLCSLLGAAGLAGFFFKDRAFCRGFCPVGLLLSTYGRGGMLAVRAGSAQVCANCTGKGCIMACNRSKLFGRSCPSLLNPPKLNSNRDCLVCGQCIKSCKPDNMQLILRRPFHPADVREPLASWPVTVFVMMVSGFVTGELCSEWPLAKSVFLWIPEHFTEYCNLSLMGGWVEGIWTICVFPLLLWFVLGMLTSLNSDDAFITIRAWRLLALPIVVIVSAGHMAKGLAKFVLWIVFLPYACKDPIGIKTALEMSSKTIRQPASLMSMTIISILGMILVITGMYFSVREAKLANPETHYVRLAPKLILGVFFAFIIFGWGYIR